MARTPVLYGLTLLATSMLLHGCTGLEPAAIGAGANVAQSAVTIFDKGKARIVDRIGFDDALAAAKAAGEALSLQLENERTFPLRAVLYYRDEHHAPITVTVERRTATMTMTQVDVGLLGEIGIASLYIKQVLEARHAGAPTSTQPTVPG